MTTSKPYARLWLSFTWLLLWLIPQHIHSQSYRNEWIAYGKTYYKLRVGHFVPPSADASNHLNLADYSGLYRISYATLQAMGLHQTPVEHFQLWRDGKEVALHTVPSSGIMSPGGYLEFWSDGNNGEDETELYRTAASHMSKRWSLFSDSASLFLTTNSSGANRRMQTIDNNPAASPLTELAYFTHTIRIHPRNAPGQGGNRHLGFADPSFAAEVRSSIFDDGEGFAQRVNNPWSFQLAGLQIPTGGTTSSLPVTVQMGVAGAFKTTSNTFSLELNGKTAISSAVANYNTIIRTSNSGVLTLADLSQDVANITVRRGAGPIAVPFINLSYPRRMDLNGSRSFKFDLPASASGYKLRVKRMNAGSMMTPVIWDLTNNRRYTAVRDGSDYLFLLNANAAASTFFLTAGVDEGADFKFITQLTPRQFIPFQQAQHQGDYLIITHSSLRQGSDAVQQYANYRSSAAGGGYQVRIYDVDELYDQFAYGVKGHPLAINNFARFARYQFARAPRFLYLIGRGVTYDQCIEGSVTDQLNLVPTWGQPASDHSLVAENKLKPSPVIPVGRLAAVNSAEVIRYLDKVKEFESGQQTPGSAGWQKNVLHLVGGNDPGIVTSLTNYMDKYRRIIADTLLGAKVETVIRVSDPNTAGNIQRFKELIGNGVSLITYFGHSSASSLDFNLNDPAEIPIRNGRYPVFIANGCNGSEFFTSQPQRLNSSNQTLSERFVLADRAGSLIFISSTHYGIIGSLDFITSNWYTAATGPHFGKPAGEIHKAALDVVNRMQGTSNPTFPDRITGEQYHFHGDPALVIHRLPMPDFTVRASSYQLKPAKPTVSTDSVQVTAVVSNEGRTTRDSVAVRIVRRLPNGQSQTLRNLFLYNLYNQATVQVTVPVGGLSNRGLHEVEIFPDPNNVIAESSETNNPGIATFEVSDNVAKPVFPAEFGIVRQWPSTLAASFAHPFRETSVYRLQMDTTELFNSPLLYTLEQSAAGSLIRFIPANSLINGRVYYWRVARMDGGQPGPWMQSSFTYLAAAGPAGSSQGHYFQHRYSGFRQLKLEDQSRIFEFDSTYNNLYFSHGIYPVSGTEDSHFSITVNGEMKIFSACVGRSLIFNVFDSASFVPWVNSGGAYGSGPVCGNGRQYNFEFPYFPASNRKLIMDFIKSIPKGMFVAVRAVVDPDPGQPGLLDGGKADSLKVEFWQRDTLLYGPNQSLYHVLKQQGFDNLDELNRVRTFGFVFKKDDRERFKPISQFTEGLFDRLFMSADIKMTDTAGNKISPQFGPASVWRSVEWTDQPILNNVTVEDKTSVSVIGVHRNGTENVLGTLNSAGQSLSLASVSPTDYRRIYLRMNTSNAKKPLPGQLNFWRVLYDPVPEGAISTTDYYRAGQRTEPNGEEWYTVPQGGTIQFGVAFRNLGPVNFPAGVQVRMQLTNSKGQTLLDSVFTRKALAAGDTIRLYYERSAEDLAQGDYQLFVVFNPQGQQAELSHENNFLYQPIRIGTLAVAPGTKIFTGSGNWSDPARWTPAGVPVCTDRVFIDGQCTVDNGSAVSDTVVIRTGGTLTLNSDAAQLNIGCASGGGNKALIVQGTLALHKGLIRLNGGLVVGTGSALVQSGGTLRIDPHTGDQGTSYVVVPPGTDPEKPSGVISFGGISTNVQSALRPYVAGTVQVTGGTWHLVDPPATAQGYAWFGNLGGAVTVSFTGTHMVRVGDSGNGVLHDAGSGGFSWQLHGGTGTLRLNNLWIDGGNATTRKWILLASPPFPLWINGSFEVTGGGHAELAPQAALRLAK